jgi:hypothetical protein
VVLISFGFYEKSQHSTKRPQRCTNLGTNCQYHLPIRSATPGLNLRRAQLNGATLPNANMKGIDLVGADLSPLAPSASTSGRTYVHLFFSLTYYAK